MKFAYGLVLVLTGAAIGAGTAYLLVSRGNSITPESHKPMAAQYQCPMHPQVTADRPGDCPICGMKMVPIHKDTHTPAGEAQIKFYRSPMNPAQTSAIPRKDEMGMDYVPVYQDDGNGSGVPGLAAIRIDSAQQQMIGLRTAEVQTGSVGGRWRTVGRVAADETRVRKVNVKVAGYVERLYADFLGKPVVKGQPLLSLYSPELLSAQKEYLVARRMQKALGSDANPEATGNELLAATRNRLLLWDIPKSALEQIERTGEPTKSLTLVSPIAGAVTAKSVVEGAYLNAGDTPLEITDLSEVWVFADVYEGELARVRVGLHATLTLQAIPDHVYEGTVSFLDPVLDPKTRTARVRLAFPNPRGELRPELFGEVVFCGDEREGLRLPADALIRSGARTVVFVVTGDGKFTPREIRVGNPMGDFIEILSGVQAGDSVVVGANFLIDSEARLRASQAPPGDMP